MIVVERLAAPDAAYVELLDKTVFGNRGLAFRRTNWPDVIARWQRLGAAFLAAREGDRTVGTYALVPHRVELAGQDVTAWYRAALSVAPDTRGKGVGAQMAAEVKRRFVDEAAGPVVCYGIVERDNEPSQRVQIGVGYAPIAACVALPVGTLRPRTCEGFGPIEPSDAASVAEKLAERWSGHVLGTDFRGSLYPEDTRVLREGGRVVAALTGRLTSVDIAAMPGLRGGLLRAASPLLRQLSPLFAMRPNRHLVLANLWWESPEALARLVNAALHEQGVAHGIVFVDDRSPHGALLREALRGPVHKLVPAPALDVWAGWKGLSDEAIRALSDRPHAFAPGDAA